MSKYALVTGGSRGIGKVICQKIASDLGYHVIINYSSNQAAAEETLKSIEEQGGEASIMQFNVTDAKGVEAALDKWHEEHQGEVIEVLVNNAGITHDGLFMLMTDNQWSNVLDVSLNGFYNVSRQLMHKMIRNRYGRVVNVVSVSGQKGTPGQVNYSAAKAGVIGATKALAQEVAKRNITVNAVAPGFINTDMTKDLNEQELKKLVPMNRFGEAEEVADLVSFLVSKKASYITGEVVNINGGIYS